MDASGSVAGEPPTPRGDSTSQPHPGSQPHGYPQPHAYPATVTAAATAAAAASALPPGRAPPLRAGTAPAGAAAEGRGGGSALLPLLLPGPSGPAASLGRALSAERSSGGGGGDPLLDLPSAGLAVRRADALARWPRWQATCTAHARAPQKAVPGLARTVTPSCHLALQYNVLAFSASVGLKP
jgi:hypothetical protein